MYVSYRWLGRHVDLEGISPEQLCEDLTLSTAEVEGLEKFAPHLSAVRVGRVETRVPHPDADKLSVCTVDVGEEENLNIVCGATNVDAGQKVAVATVGTVLPGDFKIKKSKIRGVESRGMICSVRELELGEDHDGIWVLPEAAEIGQPVADAVGLDDWVIEIDNKSLTHRPDLWGHRGIAAEIAAIYSRPLKPLSFDWPEWGDGAPYPIRIETPACSRYIGLQIDGAQATESPDWLKGLLLAVGQRSIDCLVDLSNFVMLDLGQPNHTFDRHALDSDGIAIRMAREGEQMTTLDGEDRALQPSDLLICSADRPVALAGIMGGEGSKVGDTTDALLLEIATFAPAVVRRTSSRLGLRTDASARFEKSLDPTLPQRAGAHFARLLRELQPEVSFPAPPTDVGEWTDPAHTLTLRPEQVRRELGKAIPDEEITSILERLGFGVEKDGASYAVAVPSSRSTKDVHLDRDLVEEIGRIYRYGNIEEKFMRADITPPPKDPRRHLVRALQDRLAGAGRFHETLSYSFVHDALLEKLGMLDLPHVRIVNPVAHGEERIRRSVAPSLLAGLETNRRLLDDVRLFEVGKGYLPDPEDRNREPQELHLAGLVWASAPAGAGARFDAHAFNRLQGVVTDLLDQLEAAETHWRPAPDPPVWAHPAKALEAVCTESGDVLAVVAELDPGLHAALGLSGEQASEVAVGEVSIDALLKAPKRGSRYKALARYPGIKLDVAVALPETTTAAEVHSAITKAGKGSVADAELFDLYRGDSVGAGRKSLAYHVTLQSEKKTLTEKDEQKFLKRFEALVSELGGELRNG
ncbi:MAG: phenylalanine--tRNA ligase subunit beta [Myxococcota bacterium]|jgi:phenylalanyl-tRNA synthetase beta chain|nr:phenylalanine--tRNA ligase subunit beta [Myxococcota bacterium]